MKNLAFHPSPESTLAFGFFSDGRLHLELPLRFPLCAVEPRTRLSFRINPSLPPTTPSILISLLQSCTATLQVGKTLKLTPRLLGGGTCSSSKRKLKEEASTISQPPPPDPILSGLKEKILSTVNFEDPTDEPIYECESDKGSEIFDLESCMGPYIDATKKTTVLLVGVSGVGKTRACKKFAVSLLRKQDNRVPIYIDLAHFRSIKAAIEGSFQRYGISASDLKREYRIIFILDSYERLSRFEPIFDNFDLEYTYSNSTVIVVANSFLTTFPKYKVLFAKKHELLLKSATEITIHPVSCQRLINSIERFGDAMFEAAGWGSGTDFKNIMLVSGMKTGFLLSVCFRDSTLCRHFIENNEVCIPKLLVESLLRKAVPNPMKNTENLCIEVAFDSLLGRKSNQPGLSEFASSRFMEYNRETNEVFFPVSIVRSALIATALFRDFENNEYDHYFNLVPPRCDLEALDLFRILAKDKLEDPRLRDFLIEQVKRSKDNESLSTAAANALNLAVFLGIPLYHCDFSGTILRSSDLRGGCFHGINFERADFEGSEIDDAAFIDCNISEAQLATAEKTRKSISIPITAMAISYPEANRHFRQMLAYTQGNEIHVIHCSSLAIVIHLHGHHGPVSALSFSQDESILVSTGADCTVRFWRLATGVCEWIQETPDATASSVSINSQFVVAVGGPVITLWFNGNSFQCPKLDAHSPALNVLFSELIFSHLCSNHKDNVFRFWDVYQGVLMSSVYFEDKVVAFDFFMDSVIAATKSKVFEMVSCAINGRKFEVETNFREYERCTIRSLSKLIACIRSDKPGGHIIHYANREMILSFDIDALRLVIGHDSLFIVNDAEIVKLEFASRIPDKNMRVQIQSISFGTNNEVGVVHRNNQVSIWNLKTRNCVDSFASAASRIWFDDARVTTLMRDNHLIVSQRREHHSLPKNTSGVAMFFQYPQLTVVSYLSGELCANKFSHEYKFPGSVSPQDCFVQVYANGDKLVGVRVKGTVVSWNLETNKVKTIASFKQGLPSCFHSDGTLLAGVTPQDSVEIINTSEERSLGTIAARVLPDSEVVFVDNDCLLVATSGDLLEVCSVASLQVVATLRMSGLRNLRVSGRYLALGVDALEVFDTSKVANKKRAEEWEKHFRPFWGRSFAGEAKIVGRYLG